MAGKGTAHQYGARDQSIQKLIFNGECPSGACGEAMRGPQTRRSLRPQAEISKNGAQRWEAISLQSLLPGSPSVPLCSRPGSIAEGLA